MPQTVFLGFTLRGNQKIPQLTCLLNLANCSKNLTLKPHLKLNSLLQPHFIPVWKSHSYSPNGTHHPHHKKYLWIYSVCILFSKTASRLKFDHRTTNWRSDTNKDEKWVKPRICYSSSNSDIWFLFLLLEQNVFFNIHMVYTKVQICLTACIFICYYIK